MTAGGFSAFGHKVGTCGQCVVLCGLNLSRMLRYLTLETPRVMALLYVWHVYVQLTGPGGQPPYRLLHAARSGHGGALPAWLCCSFPPPARDVVWARRPVVVPVPLVATDDTL